MNDIVPFPVKNREMSPKSNLIGNPAEPLRNEYSPAIAGAQGASLITFREYLKHNPGKAGK